MKITIQIPTVQFGLVAFEIPMPETTELTDEIIASAIESHNKMLSLYKGGFGLEHLEFNRVLDDYLWNDKISVESYEAMSKPQQQVIQEIKKAKKRKNG